jgi:SAM-dependent methyltransferase
VSDPLRRSEADPTGRFSNRAAAYAAARPSYPRSAVRWSLEALFARGADGLRLADVGAGTGLSSRAFAEAGARVVAVEPNAAMRAAAEPHPRVEWADGTGERTGLGTGAFDGVICAQAFHWLKPEAAIAEFERLVRPQGRLVILINERSARDRLTRAYSDAIRAAVKEDLSEGQAALAERALAAAGLVWAHKEFEHAHELDRDGFIARAFSASYVPTEGPKRDRLERDLVSAFRFYSRGGRVRMIYRTRVFRVLLRSKE